MRFDQLARLKELAEEVAEVFIYEADPRAWSGHGQDLADMDAETRGNRYWDKKNAIQTGTLLARVLDLAERDDRAGDGARVADEDAEEQVSRFEQKAKELLKHAQRGRH